MVRPLEEKPWEENGGDENCSPEDDDPTIAIGEDATTREGENGECEGKGEGGEVEEESLVLREGEEREGESRKEEEAEALFPFRFPKGPHKEAGDSPDVGCEEDIGIGVRRVEEGEGEAPEEVETEEAPPKTEERAHSSKEEASESEEPYCMHPINNGLFPLSSEACHPSLCEGNGGWVGADAAHGLGGRTGEGEREVLIDEEDFPAEIPVIDGIIDEKWGQEEEGE